MSKISIDNLEKISEGNNFACYKLDDKSGKIVKVFKDL